MSVIDQVFDSALVRAMRAGPSVLPADLDKLRSYLGTIGALLEEKARELEPTWEQARSTEAEIETLQDLEASVTERAIAVRSASLADVRAKLAIWRSLSSCCEPEDLRSPRSRLILSVEADLERLDSRAH